MVRVFLVEEAHLAPIQITAHAPSVRQRALLKRAIRSERIMRVVVTWDAFAFSPKTQFPSITFMVRLNWHDGLVSTPVTKNVLHK
jgi:hypothetical protein